MKLLSYTDSLVSRRVFDWQKRLHFQVGRMLAATARTKQAADDMAALEDSHPEFAEALNKRETMSYWILALGLAAVYAIDLVLFSPTAEYLAQLAFPQSPVISALAQMVVPAMFLGIELRIAAALYLLSNDEDASSMSKAMWWILGFAFALVIPAFIVSTTLADQFGSGNGEAIFVWQLIGLVLLAAVAHVSVVCGGRPLIGALGYFSFRIQRGWMKWRATSAKRQADHAGHLAFRAHLNFERNVGLMITRGHPVPPAATVFDKDVIAFIDSRLEAGRPESAQLLLFRAPDDADGDHDKTDHTRTYAAGA